VKLSPTTFRASLYFAIAFLTPFAAKVLMSLDAGKWPTGQEAVSGFIGGSLAGLIALRAYYDGSALRNAQEAETVPLPEPTPSAGQPVTKPVVT